ncbi:unnamed protein product [Phaedon cochleariae]|uniref:Uncharacterized protein n=1 Tax=Phaedon cochleariae TaxID=80249 RepID=A0A9N9SLW1_PHACE|nr:unnamed protein product [Phaedon cochleariae]
MSSDLGYESDDDFDAEIIAWANWVLREFPPQLGHQPPVVDNENGAEGLLIAKQQNMEINDDANNKPIVMLVLKLILLGVYEFNIFSVAMMEVDDEPIEINVDALAPIRDGKVIFNYIPEAGIIYDTSLSQMDSSTWNIDMQELEYNPSKKDLTDAKIHHLLAEELVKPYRRHRKLSYSRHAVNDRDLSSQVNYRMHFNMRRLVADKKHHHKRHSKKLNKGQHNEYAEKPIEQKAV